MSNEGCTLLGEQLQGLEGSAPLYDYSGLILPEGLSIDMLFGAHDDYEDMGPDSVVEWQRTLRGYDMIVVESAGWEQSYLKSITKISKGDYRERERLLSWYQLKGDERSAKISGIYAKIIYDTKAAVFFIDPPQGTQLIRDVKKGYELINKKHDGEFEDAVAAQRTAELEYAKLNDARENYMLRSFTEQTNSLIASSRKLQDKLVTSQGVQIALWGFGQNHAGLFNGVSEVARRNDVQIQSSVEFYIPDENGQFIDYHSQICGRYLHGQEVDDLLVAKQVLLLELLDRETDRHLPRAITQAGNRIVRQLDQLTIEELEALYTDLRAS